MGLSMKFSSKETFHPKFSTVVTVESDEREVYKGEYSIRPSVEEQKMSTKNKVMANDVTIEKIPFYSVSNEQNGETIIIGV